MRNRLLVVIVCLLVAAAGFVPRHAAAQSDSAIVCDSTLVTLLYLAEHDYGFKSAIDASKFEKAQFKPWFDSMMAMGGTMMEATQPAMMESTKDAMNSGAMMETTQPAMMESTKDAMNGGAMMASLKPGVVQGENESCTKLRAEIEGFLHTKLGSMTK
jgi:hypothetical protein